jgi:hypothetical protein
VNQSTGSGGWQLLVAGKTFAAGTNGYVRIANNAGSGTKNVVADAIRWVYSEDQRSAPPTITAQPVSQRVIEGGNAAFSVTAASMTPPAYQWRFNADPISGATNATLVLTQVLAAAAGNYDVTIANGAGSATSDPAALVVSVRPWLVAIPMSLDLPQLELTGTAGDRYAIELSTNFVNWSTAVTVTNTNGIIRVDIPAPAAVQNFYRARLLP